MDTLKLRIKALKWMSRNTKNDDEEILFAKVQNLLFGSKEENQNFESKLDRCMGALKQDGTDAMLDELLQHIWMGEHQTKNADIIDDLMEIKSNGNNPSQ